MSLHPGLASALLAPAPAPAHASKLMLYGQFIGDWEGEGFAAQQQTGLQGSRPRTFKRSRDAELERSHQPDGSVRRHWWRIHFGWVLEGRAVQDVWMTPPRSGPHAGESERSGDFSDQYGTSLRLYDPASDSWQVHWFDPLNGYSARLTGRPSADGILQEGEGSNGMAVRWVFSHIRPDAFHWHAEISRDKGSNWFRALDIEARRLK